MVIISVCVYGVKIILKFRWESGRSEYLMQLSVKLHFTAFLLRLIFYAAILEAIFSFQHTNATIPLLFQVKNALKCPFNTSYGTNAILATTLNMTQGNIIV